MKKIFISFLLTLLLLIKLNSQVNPVDSATVWDMWMTWNPSYFLSNYSQSPFVTNGLSAGGIWWNNGRVNGVEPSSNTILQGNLPSSIQNLSELTILDLGQNANLYGTIPPEIGNLTQLYRLIMLYNGFNTTIPPEIGNLFNLSTLGLGNPGITGLIPPTFQNLNKLIMFNLYNSTVKGNIPGYFGLLDSLKYIYCLVNPTFGGVLNDSLCLSQSIVIIRIIKNAFYGEIPPCLGTMPKLNTLNISHNNFTGPVPQSLFPPASYRMELTADSNHLTSLPFLPPEQPLPPPYYWQLTRIKDIRWNKLQFGDFENTYLNGCSYCIEGPIAPQDSVWSVLDTTVLINTTVTLNSTVTGLYNTYYWYKNGVLFDSTSGGLLIIPNVQYSDSGVYTCNVTNQYITPQYNLILNRHPIILHITNSFSSNEILNTNLKPEVFPNPFDKELTVKLNTELNLSATLSLLNSSGKTIMQAHTSAGENVFNTEKLPAGLYLIKVETERSVAVVKVNKE